MCQYPPQLCPQTPAQCWAYITFSPSTCEIRGLKRDTVLVSIGIVVIVIIRIIIFSAYRSFDYMFACVSHSYSWRPEVWFWKSNLGPLEEQRALLSPEPPFQLWKLFSFAPASIIGCASLCPGNWLLWPTSARRRNGVDGWSRIHGTKEECKEYVSTSNFVRI